MTLRDSVELWEIQTGKNQLDYLADCDIHAEVDKADLWNFLMFEYMDMKVVDSDSQFFHERVKNFFRIHKFNIDGLCETLGYDYNPLENTHWHQEEDITEHNVRDRDDNWQRKEAIDTNDNWQRQEDIDTTDDWQRKESIDTTDDWQRDYSEKGSSNEQDVHLVSAYNDETSPHMVGTDANGNPVYEFNDEEHDRTLITKSYQLSGNENKSEQTHQNQDEDKKEQTHQHQDEDKKEQIHQYQDEDKKEQEDIVDDKRKDDDTIWNGNKGQSYQSLIDEQRQSVQFNIYKWIAKHFCKELLIAVW